MVDLNQIDLKNIKELSLAELKSHSPSNLLKFAEKIEIDNELRLKVRTFMEREVKPIINGYWYRDQFPHELIPKLREFDPKLIHEANLNNSYIPKIVDLKESAKFARDQVWSIRKNKHFRSLIF